MSTTGQLFTVDWSKPPELRWIKQKCPVCGEPTGETSRCYDIDKREALTGSTGSKGSSHFESEEELQYNLPVMQSNVTVEYQGEVSAIYSEQCPFRMNNTFIVEFNYPLSRDLVIQIAFTEGVERFDVKSKYRGVILIANLFDERQVKEAITETFRNFVNINRSETHKVIASSIKRAKKKEQEQNDGSTETSQDKSDRKETEENGAETT